MKRSRNAGKGFFFSQRKESSQEKEVLLSRSLFSQTKLSKEGHPETDSGWQCRSFRLASSWLQGGPQWWPRPQESTWHLMITGAMYVNTDLDHGRATGPEMVPGYSSSPDISMTLGGTQIRTTPMVAWPSGTSVACVVAQTLHILSSMVTGAMDVNTDRGHRHRHDL